MSLAADKRTVQYAVKAQRHTATKLKTSDQLLKHRELQKQYTGNWVWRAVAALADVKGFETSPKNIANKLNVSIQEAVEALDGVEKLGIIKRTEKGYAKILKYIYFSDRDLEPRSVLSDHVLISTQIHGRLDPFNPKNGSFYRTGFVATNRKLAKEFFLTMEDLMRKFLVDSSAAETDSLYAFTLSGVDVSNNSLLDETREQALSQKNNISHDSEQSEEET